MASSRNFWRLFSFGLLITVFAVGCVAKKSGTPAAGGKKISVAYVTNGIASFWDVAKAGALSAGEELDVEVDVRMPENGVADQTQMIQDLLVRGIDGIAISPIDPANQGPVLQEAADNTILITHDSDAPESARQCYIGMDNYDAGRACGKLVKEALPEGGEIVLFVGRLDQINAQLRRQGVIDEILDRERQPEFDPPEAKLSNDKYTIVDTRVDGFNFEKAKADCQDVIAANPNLKCMVGLFAYNPPICLEAVKEAGKLDQIQLVGFDEDPATLQGIVDGEVYGTCVQNPFQYGYESVRVLKALAEGDQSVIPESKIIYFPARAIKKDNVEEFWTELKKLTGQE